MLRPRALGLVASSGTLPGNSGVELSASAKTEPSQRPRCRAKPERMLMIPPLERKPDGVRKPEVAEGIKEFIKYLFIEDGLVNPTCSFPYGGACMLDLQRWKTRNRH